MTKASILLSVLAIAATATANAQSSKRSEASKNISTGSGNSVSTTFEGSVFSIAGSIASPAYFVGDSVIRSGQVSVRVVNNPLEASDTVLVASGNTISGAGGLVWKGSQAFVVDPSGSISKAAGASVEASNTYVVAPSGQLLSQSGRALKDAYGNDFTLVSTGSKGSASDAYRVSEGAFVFVSDGASASVSQVYENSLKPVGTVSVATANAMIGDLSASPAASSAASASNQAVDDTHTLD